MPARRCCAGSTGTGAERSQGEAAPRGPPDAWEERAAARRARTRAPEACARARATMQTVFVVGLVLYSGLLLYGVAMFYVFLKLDGQSLLALSAPRVFHFLLFAFILGERPRPAAPALSPSSPHSSPFPRRFPRSPPLWGPPSRLRDNPLQCGWHGFGSPRRPRSWWTLC